MITQKRLEEIKGLFREDVVELSDDRAQLIGEWLVERFRAVGRVIPPDEKTLPTMLTTDQPSILDSH